MSGTTFHKESLDFFSSLQLTQELLNDILLDISLIEKVAIAKEFHRNREISSLTNGISTFVEITTLLAKYAQKRANELNPIYKESHIQLLFVLKAISQAQLKNDFAALEELIKYELKDILTQWKINLLPQLKKLLIP